MTLIFPLFYSLITIDRIEGTLAIVEWENLSISTLPLEIFPENPQEGSQFYLSGHPSTQGECSLKNNDPIILQCASTILFIPLDSSLWMIPDLPLQLKLSMAL